MEAGRQGGMEAGRQGSRGYGNQEPGTWNPEPGTC